MPATRPKAPNGLGTGGRRLWDRVHAAYELDEQELALLREACRTVDVLDKLHELLGKGGLGGDLQGKRLNPVLAEIRQQQLTLTKVIAALGLPQGLQGDEAPAKPRGSHPVRGARSLRAVDGV